MTTTAEIAEQRVSLLAHAEQILREVEPALQFNGPGAVTAFDIRRHFTSDQLHVFDALAWDKATLAREAARMHRVRRLEAEAGTQKDRAAARKFAEKAAKELDDRDDDILAIIRQKEAELKALTDKRDQTAAVVAKQEAAVGELRKVAPKHVQEDCQNRRLEVYRHYQAMIEQHPENREVLQQERAEDIAEVEKLLDVYVK